MTESKQGSNESFHSEKKQKQKSCKPTANIVDCGYDLVVDNIEASGFSLLKDKPKKCMAACLLWYDSVVPIKLFQLLKNYQHVNHFPGIKEICRKDLLAQNMAKVEESGLVGFDFIPKTWIMPSEYASLLKHSKDSLQEREKSTYLLKPANGANGNGIKLFRNPKKIHPSEHTIVQEYLDKPFLLDGYKFDLRLYVLVTSCDPLRIFLYQDGLVRLSTEKYSLPNRANMKQVFMHLTNYSINKESKKFERHSDFDRGSKRSIKSVLNKLKSAGHDTATLWRKISNLVVKTLLVASPHLVHAYRLCRPGQPWPSESVCFEILGFDIFIDEKLKPWLLEVNRAPNFENDGEIDRDVKGKAIQDALRLINIKASDKRRRRTEERAASRRRLFPKREERNARNRPSTSRRKIILKRRKEELAKKEEQRKKIENKNLGGYKRVFPCRDKKLMKRYARMQSTIFKLFRSQCEKPYQKKDSQKSEKSQLDCKTRRTQLSIVVVRKNKKVPRKRPRVLVSVKIKRSISLPTRPHSVEHKLSIPSYRSVSTTSTKFNDITHRKLSMEKSSDEETEPTMLALKALEKAHITFSDKRGKKATALVEKMYSKWKVIKPLLARFWFVSLNSTKRRKVINSVRENVNDILKTVWRGQKLERLRLNRLFTRVFNRLLWSRGQGLWDCFSSSDSWEVIFRKSTDTASDVELDCCRRVVQLCKDCLLIVYQIANDVE